MQTELQYLIVLQDHDNNVAQWLSKAEEFDPLIAAKNKQITDLRDQLKKSKDAFNITTLKKKELEGKVTEQENLVRKHQGELNNLKTNEAYKTMLGEIQAAKDEVLKIEDAILQSMELLDQQQAEAKAAEEKFKTDENTIKAELKKFEEEKTRILAEATVKKEEREKYAATVPVPLKTQYEAVRNKLGGVAIVAVSNSACSGCRMHLTHNKIIEVKTSKVMIMCDSCSRILFMPPEEKQQPPTDTSSATPAVPSSH